MLIIFFSLLLNIHFKKTTCCSLSRVPESSGSAVPITFTKLVVGSSRKLLSDQLGPKSCMAQRIFHIDKSHVAKVTFTARDGAGRRPLTSWRRIYFTNTLLPCLSGAHCHLVNRSSYIVSWLEFNIKLLISKAPLKCILPKAQRTKGN